MTLYGEVLDCSVRLGADDCAAAKAKGYRGVVRYLYPDAQAPKALTGPELTTIHDSGLALGVVWETTAGRMLDGSSAGYEDATEANRIAHVIGWPDDRPIYYACDVDAWPGSSTAPYMIAAKLAGGRERGVYGGVPVLLDAFGRDTATFGWVAAASSWSHGLVTDLAALWQQVGSAPGLPFDADRNLVTLPDPGLWPILAPAPPEPRKAASMLELLIGDTTFLFYVTGGTLWYRSVQQGQPQTPVALTDQASRETPLVIGESTQYGPVVYCPAAEPGKVVRATLIPSGWGMHAEVL